MAWEPVQGISCIHDTPTAHACFGGHPPSLAGSCPSTRPARNRDRGESRRQTDSRHPAEMAEVIQQYRGAPQMALIAKLNPKVRGWTNYYRACSSRYVMPRMDHLLYKKVTIQAEAS